MQQDQRAVAEAFSILMAGWVSFVILCSLDLFVSCSLLDSLVVAAAPIFFLSDAAIFCLVLLTNCK